MSEFTSPVEQRILGVIRRIFLLLPTLTSKCNLSNRHAHFAMMTMLRYSEAYTNPNLTTWVNDFKQPVPKNSFLGEC